MKLKVKFLLLFIPLLFTACVDNIDFEQANDLRATPAISVSLVNSSVTQDQLVISGVEIDLPPQRSEFTILDNDTARNDLERILFNFEISNGFDREFLLTFTFLDESGNTTHEIDLNIINNVSSIFNEEIIIANNSNFLNSRFLEVSLTILPSLDGSIIDVNTPATLIFKSAGTFYFNLN
ncbi:hypothetical protein [Tenacibaculum sp. M341]|uniref:hypothetical protein n=1 Tax=Tenacibaculum sp. M341 TaxID=2530339 RepID=UPI00105323E1|nr:hypothetical protein [Tenacibaculum sp. M341]TCI92534.1 hypothetical protein EYW44_06445 [Tenacibaculum sp. M341]